MKKSNFYKLYYSDLGMADLTSDRSNLDCSIERIVSEPTTSNVDTAAEFVVTRMVGERLSSSETQDPKLDFDDEPIETPRNNNRRLADLAAAAASAATPTSANNNTPITLEQLSIADTSNTSQSPSSHHGNISQAIGYMKDALSNLGRPSYVSSR